MIYDTWQVTCSVLSVSTSVVP